MGIFYRFKSKKVESENDNSTDEIFKKLKKLSYWIFNNYGIPVSKAVSAFSNQGADEILAPRLPFKNDAEIQKTIFQVINSYLLEYSGQNIDFQLKSFNNDYVNKEDSIFMLSEKEIYAGSEYNYLESNLNTQLFLSFNFDKLENAKTKTDEYIKTFGDLNKPKLICPSSGLAFEEFKEDGIKEEAAINEISFEEQFQLVKDEVSQLKNKFIPQSLIYCSPLMDMARWQIGFNYIDINNEIIFEGSGMFYGERN